MTEETEIRRLRERKKIVVRESVKRDDGNEKNVTKERKMTDIKTEAVHVAKRKKKKNNIGVVGIKKR